MNVVDINKKLSDLWPNGIDPTIYPFLSAVLVAAVQEATRATAAQYESHAARVAARRKTAPKAHSGEPICDPKNKLSSERMKRVYDALSHAKVGMTWLSLGRALNFSKDPADWTQFRKQYLKKVLANFTSTGIAECLPEKQDGLHIYRVKRASGERVIH